ncbi:hypothetical protein OG474_30630 [Kribbella sp. NBC_01505]|uniref:hypothetical protein n=1 Tax=Kribbella sp. NBC_01505 TaxID=2903580 RepID=UPI00386C39F1
MGTNRRYPLEEPPDKLRRHVWVTWSMRTRTGAVPGLVIEWRRTQTREWQARVVFVPDPDSGESIELWLTRELLEFIDAERPRSGAGKATRYRQKMA